MIRLLFNAFSWQQNSLRRPTLKRIFIILVVVPSMLLHILITRFFLWLDTIFYSDFKQKNIDKAVFIVGVPRSGTSFLLNLLANNQQAFTAFRLWELVFAPSIIQKKFWLFISRIFPTKAIQNFIENLFFKRMKGIHDLGLGAFEEDELLYLYDLKSVYLMFIFPELETIHQFVYPDNKDNLKERIRQQIFYKSLIKRHLYIFNKENQKYFLSKNPIHPIRLDSLTTVFPKAQYLLLQRPLEKTIASTISLNNNLYSYFCTVPNHSQHIRQRTIEMLLEWHKYVTYFNQKSDWKKLDIDFKNMVKYPSNESEKIHYWLELSIDKNYQNFLQQQDDFSKNYKSIHQYQPLTDDELQLIKRK